MYGLPLRTYHSESKLFPLFTLFDYNQIETTKSFLIGTTNQMVINHNKIKYDCIVNIDTGKISLNGEFSEKVLKPSKEEKNIVNSIISKVKTNFDDKNENWMVNMNLYEPIFEGSDDFIRNEFKNYFYDFLTNFSLAMEVANKNGWENKDENFILGVLSDGGDVSSEDEELDSGEKNGTNCSGNPNPSTKNVKRKKSSEKEYEKRKTKTVKKILSSYNLDFIQNWINTYNFKFWLISHEKNLFMRSTYVKLIKNISIVYENGDIYNGSMSRGKKHGFGVFNEISNGYVYNGNWENDLKSGLGCHTSFDNKNIYDGEWKENKKHGQGQLIIDKIKYSGIFKMDLYHGSGILCDSEGNIYEGDFVNLSFLIFR